MFLSQSSNTRKSKYILYSILWWIFSDTIDRAVDYTPPEMKSNSEIHTENMQKHKYVETQFEKNHTERREFTIFKGIIVNSTELKLCF